MDTDYSTIGPRTRRTSPAFWLTVAATIAALSLIVATHCTDAPTAPIGVLASGHRADMVFHYGQYGAMLSDGTTVVALHRVAPLPPLPDSIFSTFGMVAVHRGHPVPCDNAPGCFVPRWRLLFVDDSVDATLAWRILRHERFHLALHDANVGLPPEEEDHLANIVANFDVAEMIASTGHGGPPR